MSEFKPRNCTFEFCKRVQVQYLIIEYESFQLNSFYHCFESILETLWKLTALKLKWYYTTFMIMGSCYNHVTVYMRAVNLTSLVSHNFHLNEQTRTQKLKNMHHTEFWRSKRRLILKHRCIMKEKLEAVNTNEIYSNIPDKSSNVQLKY